MTKTDGIKKVSGTESVSDKKTLRKILILQTAFIGDVVLTLPVIQVVHRNFPKAEIHFLTIPASENLVETHPFIHKLWIFDKRGKDRGNRGLLRMARQLRGESFDLAIVPHRSLRSALLVYFAGIPIRIGFDRSSGSLLFNRQIKYHRHIHEVERNLSLLTGLDLEAKMPEYPDIVSSADDLQKVDAWLDKAGIRRDEKLICLAPGSVWPTKRWPANYWKHLTKLLTGRGYRVLLIGGNRDRDLLPLIENENKSGIFSAMGDFSLRQSTELIRRAVLLISNDSSPTHLGVAAGTPVLTIFGSTVPAFGFYPYGPNDRVAEVENLYCRPCTDHGRKKCPLKHFRCMQVLKPETVFKIGMEMLNESRQNKS